MGRLPPVEGEVGFTVVVSSAGGSICAAFLGAAAFRFKCVSVSLRRNGTHLDTVKIGSTTGLKVGMLEFPHLFPLVSPVYDYSQTTDILLDLPRGLIDVLYLDTYQI